MGKHHWAENCFPFEHRYNNREKGWRSFIFLGDRFIQSSWVPHCLKCVGICFFHAFFFIFFFFFGLVCFLFLISKKKVQVLFSFEIQPVQNVCNIYLPLQLFHVCGKEKKVFYPWIKNWKIKIKWEVPCKEWVLWSSLVYRQRNIKYISFFFTNHLFKGCKEFQVKQNQSKQKPSFFWMLK